MTDDTTQADDSPARTTVEDWGDSDLLEIDGVREKTVYVDFFKETPRLLVYADDGEEPTHVIDLPADE